MSLDDDLELILPGDALPQLGPLVGNPQEPTDDTKPKTLRLGPGLHLSPFTPGTPILPYQYGTLHVTSSVKRPTASITSTPRHYHPSLNDVVLVTLLRSTAEQYIVQLTPYTPPAIIPFTSYIINNAGTTAAVRKSRPNLPLGATIYARVALVHKHLEAVELSVPGPEYGEVVSQKGKKSSKDSSSGAGGGGSSAATSAARNEITPYVLSISQQMTKVLMSEDGWGKPLFSAMGAKLPFEMIVGKNGRVWIDGATQKDVIKVVKCFSEYDEKEMWNDADEGKQRIKELVGRVCGR